MKSVLKFIITGALQFKAKSYLKRNRTQIIAITGSMGKTSTKEAIYTVLKDRFSIYRSQKSFNTPLGLSLSVLQEEESGFSSIKAWWKIMRRVLKEEKPAYQKMVLEMGADRPGDIKKLKKIAFPQIAVVTNVSNMHMAEGQFKNIAEIAKEKGSLIKDLPKEALAILNYDDPYIREMETEAKKITFAVESAAMVMAKDIQVSSKNLKFTVVYNGDSAEFIIPVLGKFQVYVFLPAIAIGLQMGMTLKECAEALKDFHLPPGRMSYIEGVNRSAIIDSSYNAGPATMEKALELLGEIKAEYRIAALGTMNELGEMSKQAHLDLGKKAAEVSDLLISVGPEAATIKQGALDAGMSEDKIFSFFDSEEAGNFLKGRLSPKDVVLVKGSQNRVRMEKLVKAVMNHPEKAATLLCRQGEAWERI